MKPAFIILSLFGLLALVQCRKDDDVYTIGSPNGINTSEIIHISSLSPLSVEADSSSSCLIGVQLDPNTDSAFRTVIFHSSLGLFPNGSGTDTARADANGLVTLPLLSNTTGNALVNASAGTFTVDTVITFTAALPDDLLLVADKYTGSTSDSFNITCNLFRNPGRGRVSDPVKVAFSAIPDTTNNSPALILPSFGYSIRGEVKITVNNPFQNTGKFLLQAFTTSDKGDSLKQNVTILIK